MPIGPRQVRRSAVPIFSAIERTRGVAGEEIGRLYSHSARGPSDPTCGRRPDHTAGGSSRLGEPTCRWLVPRSFAAPLRGGPVESLSAWLSSRPVGLACSGPKVYGHGGTTTPDVPGQCSLVGAVLQTLVARISAAPEVGECLGPRRSLVVHRS
jgi:hypothetical protein